MQATFPVAMVMRYKRFLQVPELPAEIIPATQHPNQQRQTFSQVQIYQCHTVLNHIEWVVLGGSKWFSTLSDTVLRLWTIAWRVLIESSSRTYYSSFRDNGRSSFLTRC